MKDEDYSVHKDTIESILTIISSALTLEEIPRQREIATKEIMKFRTAPDFGEEGAKEWKDFVETLSLEYEYEVRMLIGKIPRGLVK